MRYHLIKLIGLIIFIGVCEPIQAQDLTLDETREVLCEKFQNYQLHPIQLSAVIGDVEGIKAALAEGIATDQTSKSEILPSTGVTALMLACYFGRAEVVRTLIEAGANVNQVDGKGLTPLMVATGSIPIIGNDHAACMKLLIENGADVNFEANGASAITYSCGRIWHILWPPGEVFLQKNRPPNPMRNIPPGIGGSIGIPSIEPRRKTVARYSSAKRLQILLDAGATIPLGSDPISFLNKVISYGDNERLVLLLNAGVKPGQLVGNHRYLITRALMWGTLEAAQTLIESGIKLDHQGKNTLELLRQTVMAPEEADAKLLFLLDHGIELRKEWLPELVKYCLLRSDGSALPTLVDQGAKLDGLNANAKNPVLEACDNWTAEALRVLLTFNYDVNDRSQSMRTYRGAPPYPLILAAASLVDSAEKCQVLIDAGVDINTMDSSKATAINHAAAVGNFDALITLAEAGADVNIFESSTSRIGDHQDLSKMTPLMYVANRGTKYARGTTEASARAAAVLIEHGANVNARTTGTHRALHFALRSHNPAVVNMLLDAGADATCRTSENETPFMIVSEVLWPSALDISAIEIMERLIKQGAKIERQDNDGNTPFLLAARSLRVDRCAFLLDIGADSKARNKAGKNALKLAKETYEKAACAWNAKRLAAVERVLADHGIIEDE